MDKPLRQAGVIPYRIAAGGKLQVLLVTSRDTGRWVIPKGYIDDGMTAPQAAQQEAWEEAGISGEIVPGDPLGFIPYLKTLNEGGARPATIEVYAMRVTRQASKWPEQKERRRKWFSPANAAGRVKEPDLAALLLRMADLFPVGSGAPA